MSINPLAIIVTGLAVGVAVALAWPGDAVIRPWHVGGLLCIASDLNNQLRSKNMPKVSDTIGQIVAARVAGTWRMHPMSNVLASIGIAMALTSLCTFVSSQT